MANQKIISIIVIILLANKAWPSDPITIDGLFDDWSGVPVAFSDPNGDGYDEDFAELKITNDNDFLFLRLSFFNSEHLLQDFNGIRVDYFSLRIILARQFVI